MKRLLSLLGLLLCFFGQSRAEVAAVNASGDAVTSTTAFSSEKVYVIRSARFPFLLFRECLFFQDCR